MGRQQLTPFIISLQNIKCRPFRSFSLTVLIFMLSFIVTGGSILAVCLLNGTGSMSARLGADALIVPSGYESDVESALLRGEPSSFYFDGGLVERLTAVEGIERVSPQLFIASLNSEHCSVPVQIIGYNPETDFVISPWLAGQLNQSLPDDYVVVGYSVEAKPGDELSFFYKKYKVAAKLENTGMGFDSSVFMNMTAARASLDDYVLLGGTAIPNIKEAVSSLAVSLKSGYDTAAFARSVRIGFRSEGVGVVLPQAMISGIAENLQSLIILISLLIVFLWVLVVVVLAILFSVTLNERKREFGILRALGATRGRLGAIILTEAALISLIGSLTGTALLSLLYFCFNPLLSLMVKMPFLQPSPGKTAFLLTGGFLLAFLTGPVASGFSALKIGRLATYAIIKEGE